MIEIIDYMDGTGSFKVSNSYLFIKDLKALDVFNERVKSFYKDRLVEVYATKDDKKHTTLIWRDYNYPPSEIVIKNLLHQGFFIDTNWIYQIEQCNGVELNEQNRIKNNEPVKMFKSEVRK